MTTVAAVLAVILVTRPEPEPVVRIVRVPVERPAPLPEAPDVHEPPAGSRPSDRANPGDESAESRWAGADRRPFGKWLAWLGSSPQTDRIAAVGRVPYPAMLDSALAGGQESYPLAKRDGRVEETAAPVPYRQLLEQALSSSSPGSRS
jgi:hypothetical protein